MKRTTERVAELGYAALAADVWGDGAVLSADADIGPILGRFAGDRKMWMGRLKQAQATSGCSTRRRLNQDRFHGLLFRRDIGAGVSTQLRI